MLVGWSVWKTDIFIPASVRVDDAHGWKHRKRSLLPSTEAGRLCPGGGGEGVSMGSACCWVLKGQAAPLATFGWWGVLVSSAPGAGLAPIPVLFLLRCRGGVGVLVGGFVGLWVGGCL
jgi:hypothetical protein